MVADLIRALLAATAGAVLPGYFWAAVLRPASGLGERLAYSTVISMASVPVIAVILARAAGTGVALWVAVASALIVFGSGLAVFRIKGPAPGTSTPALRVPDPVRDPRVLGLIAAAIALGLVMMAARRPPAALLLLIAVALIAGGALMAWPRPAPEPGEPPSAPEPGGSPPPPGPGTFVPAPLPAEPTRASATAAEPAATVAAGPAAPEPPQPGAGTSATSPGTSATTPGTSPAIPGTSQTVPETSQGASATSQSASATPEGASGRSGTERVWGYPLAGVRDGGLAAILLLTAIRAYSGVIRFEWPYISGGDQFSHAVMAEQMLAHGAYPTYLIYPPGFSALTAVISRFAGLAPLALFPVLAPMLLVVTALGAYALATRLWGWQYGLGAAALSGLVLTGAFNGFAGGRYPDLVSAFFLLVMTVAALVTLYEEPSLRSGALVTVAGASAVLYHSVASMYLAVLLALVALIGLPYLIAARRPREARALFFSLAGVAVLSAVYAAYIYGGHSTSGAVSIVLGSQPPAGQGALLTELGPPIVWFGVLGAAALAASLRYLRRPAQVLTVLTVVGWCVLMYAGSRTSVDGFPQRFERDLGAPLSVTAALAIGLIVRSLPLRRPAARPAQTPAAQTPAAQTPAAQALAVTTAAVLAAVMLVAQFAHAVRASDRSAGEILDHRVAAAGQWLARHNTGGTIISTPYMNKGVTNRAVLAMGGYAGLQAYSPSRIAHPRSLPTAGRGPLLDSQEVLLHPQSCQSAGILVRQDVRYVVLYRVGTGADVPAFGADPARYQRVFENPAVIIYATRRVPCG